MNEEQSIGSVRPSRDGHQFHEAWAARVALELLRPDTNLTALAIEGFSHEDSNEFSDAAHEIADIVRYRGGTSNATATQIETLQLKYSVTSALTPMRASEMAKTLNKFVLADLDILKSSSSTIALYELVTNRPIDNHTLAALDVIRTGKPANRRIEDQATQLRTAINLDDKALISFANRLTLTGTGNSLEQTEYRNLQTLASWSGATDNLSNIRLSNLQKLVRDRAGSRGLGDNLLGRIDILGALNIAHERDLYPVRAAFPKIETAIERPVLDVIIAMLFEEPRALLIHAAGGVGKTVLMQALAKRLCVEHCVIVFDGFGAGRWRDPSDRRHLPRKSLTHIANLLASEGLCDLLMESNHDEDAIAAFRERLEAAVGALRNFKPRAEIILILDAIDHCGIQARRTGTRSFAQLALQSLNVAPIEGVRVIGSCRTHRRQDAQGDSNCRQFEIPPFTREETERLVYACHKTATQTDITVLQHRSKGNPRMLDNLLRRGPPFDTSRPAKDNETLEVLLTEQVDAAEQNAISRGATTDEARGLLAGLALLPPPVPPEELAAALGLSTSDVQSFVSDLFPLIESTTTGLIFRDEPTETAVVSRIEEDTPARNDLITRLQARQNESIYAARALPGILLEVDAIDSLVALSFDTLESPGVSRIARRAIRLARLNSAAFACARARRIDDLINLALETARISSATERSDAYLRANPDLVALSDDPEAIRRFRDDRSDWPGARHASLAVLDAFGGDMNSAALESDRALTWLNWWIREQNEGRSRTYKNISALEAKALLVQLLLGKAVRVGRWLATLQGPYAYEVAAAVLKLADKLATIKKSGEAACEFWNALWQCRVKTPAVLVAILEQPRLPPEARVRLSHRLAGLPTEPFVADSNYKLKNNYTDAVLKAAGQALGLGLVTEAQAILLHISLRPPQSYNLDDPWQLSGGNIARHVKRAAVVASAKRRSSRLSDILPEDMIAVVPISIRRRGPAAVERRLQHLISEAQNSQGKPPKKRLGREEARRWEQRISQRLNPLITLVDQLVAILTSKNLTEAVDAAISIATDLTSNATNYPYRDQTSFLSHLFIESIRWAAACRAPLDRVTGDRLAKFLEHNEPYFVSDWLQMIDLLARSSTTQAAALRLAQKVETVITADTNISEQIRDYGALANALLPISIDEARPYFLVGLELADAVGSDDQERIGDFVALLGQYQGEPLDPETVHRFVQFCELNLPEESESMDWRAFGQALSNIAGTPGLAPIARLADRNKVDLGWSLPPMLSALVQRERVRPELAAGIFGIASFQARWNWFSPNAARLILPHLGHRLREPFAEMLLIDLDRDSATQMRTEVLEGYRTLFAAELSPSSPALRRITALLDHRNRTERSESPIPTRTTDWVPEPLHHITELSPKELRALIDRAAEKFDGRRPADGFLLTCFVPSIIDPAPRSALLVAVTTDEEFDFQTKLQFLSKAREHWHGQSKALDHQISQTALSTAFLHLDEIVKTGDTWRRPLSQIASLSNDPSVLVTEILKALPGQNVDTSSDFWMACATILAKDGSSLAVGEAVSRYVTNVTERIPNKIGDGPWRKDFCVSSNVETIIAKLIWMRLGAQDASDRWRAAHAVRRLIALGENRVVDILVERMDEITAGPFGDSTLPFFHLHARLWLLITISRLAKDKPEIIHKYREKLEAIAADEQFSHVLFRHFAIAALRTLAERNLIDDQDDYLNWLDGLNKPTLPRSFSSEVRPDYYDQRPQHRPRPNPPFRFEYEFSKHQLDPLGHLFGLTHWDVEDTATSWVRKFDAKIESMWESPRHHWSNDRSSNGSTSFPEFDLYGSQLAWHAMLLSAGQFAREQPIKGYSWEDAPWEEWVSDRGLSCPDGLWLADGTDLFPLEDQSRLLVMSDGAETPILPLHPLDLLPIAGFDDSLQTPETFLVHGDWESAEELDVSISSQLVPHSDARTIAHAVYSAEPFFAYLPLDEDSEYGFDRRDACEKRLMIRWLVHDQHNSTRLDGHDPYGFSTALKRSYPSPEIAEKMQVRKADPFSRAWVDSQGHTIFKAEAWGKRCGYGRDSTSRGGTKLTVRRDALEALLRADDLALLLLIKVRRYLKKDPNDDHFRHQMLALIVRQKDPVEIIWSVPTRVKEAIARIGRQKRFEFGHRFCAIESLAPLRRQRWPTKRARSTD